MEELWSRSSCVLQRFVVKDKTDLIKKWHHTELFYELLPPANEVLGKVIFLHLFVILFTGGGWYPSMPCSGGCVLSKHALQRGGGVPARGGVCLVWGGLLETPLDGYCCGRYASYWNAFLFMESIWWNYRQLATMPVVMLFRGLCLLIPHLPPANEVAKVMFSVVSVCPLMTTIWTCSNLLNFDLSVQVPPTHTHICSNLFTMKPSLWASGRLVFS